MNFPPSPKAYSSSAGVLGKDRDKDKPDGDGDFNEALYLPGEKGAESSPSRQRATSPTTVMKLIPILVKVLFQWSSIIQKGMSHDTSSHSGADG